MLVKHHKEILLNNPTTFINDPKFAKVCDYECGGIDPESGNTIKDGCSDTTHAAYQIRQWISRYSYFQWFAGKATRNYLNKQVTLRLDEADLRNVSDGHMEQYPRDEYAQLYIPYDYFEKACKMIKSVYSKNNDYIGYKNYMKYWAKNGNPDWICNTEEYAGPTSGKSIVKNTYLVTNYWNYYDGKKSPLDGSPITNSKNNNRANGF